MRECEWFGSEGSLKRMEREREGECVNCDGMGIVW